MTSQSRAFRLLWWSVCLMPAINLALAWDSRSARSSDEALGSVVLSGLLFFAIVGLAPYVVYSMLKSHAATPRERVFAAILAAAVIPLYFLIAASWDSLGWQNRHDPDKPGATLYVILTVIWVGGLIALRRWYRQA
jgi:FtsH-binding integral membrane protein